MKRYRWEMVTNAKDFPYAVYDVKRGTPDRYTDECINAVALCQTSDDAQQIVYALNAADQRRLALEDAQKYRLRGSACHRSLLGG